MYKWPCSVLHARVSKDKPMLLDHVSQGSVQLPSELCVFALGPELHDDFPFASSPELSHDSSALSTLCIGVPSYFPNISSL